MLKFVECYQSIEELNTKKYIVRLNSEYILYYRPFKILQSSEKTSITVIKTITGEYFYTDLNLALLL